MVSSSIKNDIRQSLENTTNENDNGTKTIPKMYAFLIRLDVIVLFILRLGQLTYTMYNVES